MNLVLFEDAMMHLMRINRTIRQKRGSAMLVGVGGSGKQSLTRLAAFISGHYLFQITITKTYRRGLTREIQFMEDVTFIFTDQDVINENFLEIMNSMLATGEVVGLLQKDEKETAINEVCGLADRRHLAQATERWRSDNAFQGLWMSLPAVEVSTSAPNARTCIERWLSPMTENGFRSGMLTLTTTALGGGVLSVSFVMNICGVGLGCLMLMTGALLAYLGMDALMDMSNRTGCSSYAALFSYCAGTKAGPILDAMLFIYGNGACVGYMVFIGDFVPNIIALIFPENWAQDTKGPTRTCSILIAAVLLVPMMLPNDLSKLKFLQPVSIMSLLYMSIVVTVKCPGMFRANSEANGPLRLATFSLHFFEAFALCVFAFNCHLNVIPIADRLVRPTRERMKKVSARVNIFQCAFYVLIGVTGYLSFLNATLSDILENYNPTDYFVAAGRCFLTLTMMVAIPANLNPTVKSGVQLKEYFVKSDPTLLESPTNVEEARDQQPCFRIAVSIACLACQAVVAVNVPNVGTVLSLLGATVATAMMLVIPAYCMGIVLENSLKRRSKQA
ncbi:Dnah5, partial [Symbiodinium necroappetens]